LPPLDQETINAIVGMLEGGRLIEAIVTLEQLREAYPAEPIVPKLLGMAYGEVGELSGAAQLWEEAERLDPDDISLRRLLAGVYQSQGRPAHALRSLRRYLAADPADEELAEIEEVRRGLEGLFAEMGRVYNLPVAEVERGTLLLERGLRAMEEGDLRDAVRRFRDAARILPRWTAPQNNLALANFLLGNADVAIEWSEKVLAADPNDVGALTNLVRFLVVLARRDEALPLGDRLETIVQGADPAAAASRMLFEKAADAFAMLEQDERAAAALQRLPREALGDYGVLTLGAALANTGRKSTALETLQELVPHPRAARMAEALRHNENPPGGRFRAIGSQELLPPALIERLGPELDRLAASEGEAREAAVRGLLGRFPTFLPAFTDSLWLEDELQSARAVGVLLGLGVPEALEALRAFAFGRVGPDETRLHAVLALRESGKIDANKPVYLWQDGRYQELRLPRYEIVSEDEEGGAKRPYPPAIAKQMAKAVERHQRGDLDGAARLYRQVLEQDRSIEDAEQHLGLIEIMGGDEAAAEPHFVRALELDPEFVLPRCTLASLRISQGRVSEARDLLIPLTDRTRFRPTELASYLFTTAELAAADGDPARARAQLRLLLAYIPDHTPARQRLREFEREEAERRRAESQRAVQGLQPAQQPATSPSGLILPGR